MPDVKIIAGGAPVPDKILINVDHETIEGDGSMEFPLRAVGESTPLLHFEGQATDVPLVADTDTDVLTLSAVSVPSGAMMQFTGQVSYQALANMTDTALVFFELIRDDGEGEESLYESTVVAVGAPDAGFTIADSVPINAFFTAPDGDPADYIVRVTPPADANGTLTCPSVQLFINAIVE